MKTIHKLICCLGLGIIMAPSYTYAAPYQALNEKILSAITKNEIYNFKRLIARGADINFQNPNTGFNALMITSEKGPDEFMEYLLGLPEIKVNLRNKYHSLEGWTDEPNDTALILAARVGNTSKVDMLLKHPDIDVNMQNHDGATALIEAADNKQPLIVERLLADPRIKINIQNNYKWAAIIASAFHEDFMTLTILLKHPEIDVNLRTKDSFSAITWAALKGAKRMCTALLEHRDSSGRFDVHISSNELQVISNLAQEDAGLAQALANWQAQNSKQADLKGI